MTHADAEITISGLSRKFFCLNGGAHHLGGVGMSNPEFLCERHATELIGLCRRARVNNRIPEF